MTNQSPAEALRQEIADILRNGKYGYSDYATAENLMELVTAYAATVEREARIAELKAWKEFFHDLTSPQTYVDFESWADARLAALQGPIQDDAPDHSKVSGP